MFMFVVAAGSIDPAGGAVGISVLVMNHLVLVIECVDSIQPRTTTPTATITPPNESPNQRE